MTIKDLAAQTGYSVGTVSRVLNNQPHVSEQAREAILQAARESGFQLNANAKQLKQQHSNTIAVICKGKSNELFDSLLVALQARMAKGAYPLTVDYIDESENEVRRAVQLCLEKKPLAVLFLGGNHGHFQADFHHISQPCVLVTNSAADLPFRNLSSVSVDDTQAARIAVEHLIALGHTHIGVLGGHRHYSDTTALRYAGCVQAFREHGIAFDEERDYENSRFSYEDGYRGTQALLARNPQLTAVFAMSDVMAIGAIRALNDAGKRVPEDVSVVGFDGLVIGGFLQPRLSTIRQDVEAMAEQALALLRRSIEEGAEGAHETIPVTLLDRESTRKL